MEIYNVEAEYERRVKNTPLRKARTRKIATLSLITMCDLLPCYESHMIDTGIMY